MSDIAALGLSIEYSSVDKGTAALDRLTAAGKRAESQASATGDRASAAAAKIEAAQERAASAAQRLATAVDTSSRAMDAQARAARAADIAAYGAELDRLRAKFNPVYAAIRQYKSQLVEIRAAHAAGAISTKEMTAAIASERAATLASIETLKTRTQVLRQMGSAARQARGDPSASANIAYQFQDIGVTAAMGMNPLMIALQQGPQISAVLANTTGGAKALGAALLSVFSLTSVLTIALVAAAAAGIQWMTSEKKGVETLDKTMERHAATVQLLTERYGEAATAAKTLGSSGGQVFLDVSIRLDEQALKRQLLMQFEAAEGTLRDEGMLTIDSNVGTLGALASRDLPGPMKAFQSAITDLLASIRAGNSDLGAFSDNVEGIYQTLILKPGADANSLRGTADAILGMGDKAVLAGGKFGVFADQINRLMLQVAEGSPNIQQFVDDVNAVGRATGFEDLADEAIGLVAELVKVANAMKEISAARFRATEAARDRITSERMGDGSDYFEQRDREEAQSKKIFDAEMGRIRARTDAEKIAAAQAEVAAQMVVKGRERDRAIFEAGERVRVQLEQEATRAAEARTRAMDEQVLRSQQDLEMIGKSVGEVARLQAEYAALAQLRQESAETGRAIDEAEIARIRQKAAELGRIAEETARINLMNDLMFQREQMTRSPVEQDVAQSMRQIYGVDYKNYMTSAEAETIRFNALLDEQNSKFVDLSDTIRETLGGALYEAFTGGIRSADDFFQFVAQAFAKLAQQNFDSLVQKFLGKPGTPGLGGLASFFGGGSAPAARSSIASRGEMVSFAKVIGYEVGDAVAKAKPEGPIWERQGRSGAMALGQGVGEGVAPVIEKSFDRTFEAFKVAISTIESGSAAGNYNAVGQWVTRKDGSTDRAYGRFQVMGDNIASWTKQALGVSMSIKDFVKSKSAQDAVFRDQYDRNMSKYGNVMDAMSVWFTGKPRSAVAGKPGINDGFNTADQYAQKFTDAYNKLPGAVEIGAKDGTAAGSADGIISALEPQSSASATTSQQAQNGLGSKVMGGISSALGGFSTGYQSADPMMGALGGAMQGFGATGNPLGAVIGGIAGLIGGLLGGKKKLEQAKKNLEKAMKQIDLLLAVGEGKGVGEKQKTLTDYLGEIDKAVPLAWKAKEMELVERLHQAYNSMFIRLNLDFQNAFAGTAEAYSTGMGRNSPRFQGSEAVFDMREELRAMIADVRFFGEKNIELIDKSQLTPEAFTALQAQMTDLMNTQVATATEAARKMALAFILGTEPLTDTQKAVGSLKGAAETLIPTLVELGMTAEDAARAIDGQVVEAMKKLKKEFEEGLTAEINENKGQGYFNEVKDLLESYEKMQADAKLLGASQSQVEEWFATSAQAIVDGSQLVGTSFDALIAAFPELQGVVREFVDGMQDAGTRLKDYEDRLFAATNDTSTRAGALAAFDREANRDRAAEAASGGEHMVLLEQVLAVERLQIMKDFADRAAARALSYENRAFAANTDTDTLAGQLAAFDRAAQQERIDEIKQGGEAIASLDKALAAERAKIIRDHNKQILDEQKRALEEAQSFFDGLKRTLKEFIDDMKAGPDSPLSPEARLAEAQSQFSEQYAKALTGDRDAANALTSYASNLLDAARGRFASSEGFQDIWNDIIAKLEALPNQVSAEQFIVDEITEAIETSTGATVSATQIMQETLEAAILRGPEDAAAALSLYFDKLDTSVNGLLDYAEFSAGLDGMASDAELQRIFTELDINGDLNVSKLEAMLVAEGLTRTTLQAAILSGPAATAGTLAQYFNKLDTSVNGLLDKAELTQAIGNLASEDQIDDLIRQLDTNGDGQLSQLELIKGATQGTQTNLDASTGVIKQLADMRAILQEKLSGTNTLLIDQTARTMNALNSSNVRLGGPGGFLGGGFTGTGPATGIAGLVHNQEYVNRASTVSRLGVDFFRSLDRGMVPAVPVASNDNRAGTDAVVAELRALRAEVAALRAERRQGDQEERQTGERIASATEKTATGVAGLAVTRRMEDNRPRRSGTNG